jgi:hypothetical protein
MILRPQRNYTVVRQIANHTDVATYYVRAVVRDSTTDEILATLNLDDKGGQRFTKTWLVCADPSGLGRDISIVTSVYTDSGYTTKSSNYGDEENSHVVEDNQPIGRGGGLDARTVKRVVTEVMQAHHEKMMAEKEVEPVVEVEKEAPEPIDFGEVLSAIKGLETKLKPKEVKPVDLKPIAKGLNDLAKKIEDKEVTDIDPILKRLDEKDGTDELTSKEIKELVAEVRKVIIDELPKFVARVMKDVVFASVSAAKTLKEIEDEKKEEDEPLNINTLTK